MLAAPLNAIYSRPDGSTFISTSEYAAPTDSDATTKFEVRTGDSADGWVAIEIAPGEQDVDSGTFVVVGRTTASPASSR